MTSLNVLSLFSGIGGLELGLERTGMTVVGQVEIDAYCRTVLAKHWPNVPRHDDVRTAAEWWLNSICHWCEGTGYANPTVGDCFCRREARRGAPGRREGIEWRPRVDVICGGFPCQDISSAGRRAGISDGEQSSLWSSMAAAVRRIRPRYVLVENVPRVLVRQRDGVIPAELVSSNLAALGYDLRWDCLPAAAFGAPHIRDRWFCVAHTEREQLRLEPVAEPRGGSTSLIGDDGATRSMADATNRTEPGQPEDSDIGRLALSPRASAGDRARLRRTTEGTRQSGRSASVLAAPMADPDREPMVWPSITRPERHPWATEPDVGRVVDGISGRVDRAHHRARIRALGNAVVPQVAEYVGRLIVDHASAA